MPGSTGRRSLFFWFSTFLFICGSQIVIFYYPAPSPPPQAFDDALNTHTRKPVNGVEVRNVFIVSCIGAASAAMPLLGPLGKILRRRSNFKPRPFTMNYRLLVLLTAGTRISCSTRGTAAEIALVLKKSTLPNFRIRFLLNNPGQPVDSWTSAAATPCTLHPLPLSSSSSPWQILVVTVRTPCVIARPQSFRSCGLCVYSVVF